MRSVRRACRNDRQRSGNRSGYASGSVRSRASARRRSDLRQLRPGRQLELLQGRAAVVELRARVANVVEMKAVDVVVRDELGQHSRHVGGCPWVDGRQVEAFDFGGVVTRPARKAPEVFGAARVDGEQIGGQCARHHQPVGLAVHEVLARCRQRRCARNQIDRHPRVDLEASTMGELQRHGQRIETRPRDQLARARLMAAAVVRIAASADLHDEGVEAGAVGGVHHASDRTGELSVVRVTHNARTSGACSS